MVGCSGTWKTRIAVPTWALKHHGLGKYLRASFDLCPLISKLRITVLSLIGVSVAKTKCLKGSPSLVPDTRHLVNYSGHSCFQHMFTGHLLCARDCSRSEVSKPWGLGQIWPTRCSVFGFSLPDSLMPSGLNKAKFFQLIHILSKLNMILKHPASIEAL